MNKYEAPDFKDAPRSYWMDSTSPKEYPTLDRDITVDVAIIGGGIVGISTGYFLKDHGLNVAILEANHILQGTTGHTTAKITSQHGLIYSKIKHQLSEEHAKQYATANETAIHMIKKIAKENNIDCDYITQSAYDYTLLDEYVEKIKSETKAALDCGIKATYLDEIPLPFPVKAAIRFDGQAAFHPLKFLIPLAEKIHRDGIQIYEQSRVVDIEEDGKYILITNQGKKVSADKVIIASHYPFYNKHGMYFTRIYTERSYAIAIKAKEKYLGGMYINAEDPGRSFRNQMTDQGELIIIGGEHHKTGQGVDTNEHYKTLANFANKIFTVQNIPYRWSTQDCMTLDDIPYVGHFTSKTPNLYIATGFGKWGMTNSIASAMLLKDLIISGSSPWQDVYDPSRKTLTSSTKTFVVENLNVAEQLIGGKLAPLPSDADIHPGEGKIFASNGQRIGVYMNKQGCIHSVDTTCSHMGCELNWNSAEGTWDCPCHGSRFTYDGDIVDGPTVTPLNVNKDLNTIEKLIKDDF